MTALSDFTPEPCPDCRDAGVAWEWVGLLVETALTGDQDARRLLPRVIEHALMVERHSAGELTS